MRPLERLTILELSRGPACALAGMVLAELGAAVIRIEPSGAAGPRAGHRAKASLTADLGHDEGRRIVRELAQGADALLEDLPAGELARQGLDYAVLASRNPRLVFVSCTGAGTRGGAPAAGLWAVSALLAAIAGRERTGRGAWVDCSAPGGEAFLRLHAPEATPAEAARLLADPGLRARGMVGSYDDPASGEARALALPLKFLGWDDPVIGRPPGPGEHTERILKERLGYTEAQIADLRRAGAI